MKSVSVVVPVYNGGKYVEKCINRLISEEEYIHEIIIVNDGSKDNTKEILDRYSSIDKIIVITQENKGVSAARNRGIEASTGEWIVFCDVDDEIKEGFFCDITRSLEERSEADLICYARGRVGRDSVDEDLKCFDKKKAVLLSIGFDVDNLLKDYIFMSVWSKVFRRKTIAENQIRFNEKISYAEDVLFLVKCLVKSERIDLIHRGYYIYLPNEEGACKRGGSIRDYEGFFEFNREVSMIIEENPILSQDEEVISELKNYMFSFGRIMCGRVVRGTVGEKLGLRRRFVKDICKKTSEYKRGVSLKKRIFLSLKYRFTCLYIFASDMR